MDTVACPRCGTGIFDPARIVDGFATCTDCSHRAAATYLGEQVWLEKQERHLTARLVWVREQVRAGTPPSPDAATAPFTAGAGAADRAGAGAGAGAGAADPAGGPSAPAAVQGLLLATGAVLLVAAAAVFVAVTWDRLGPGGQLTALGCVVAALAAAAQAARTRYRGTAETLAAVAAGITVIALLAAPALGLVPDRWPDNAAVWACISFATTAVLAALLGTLSGVGVPHALTSWRAATVAGLLAAAQAGVLARAGGSDVSPAAPAVLAVVAAGLLRLRPLRSSRYRAEATAAGAGLGGLALLNGLAAYGQLDDAAWWSLSWAAVAACGAVLIVDPRRGPADQAAAGTWVGTGTTADTGTARIGRALLTAGPGRVTPAATVLAAGLGQALVLAVHAATEDPSVALPVLAVCGCAPLAATLRPRWQVPGAVAAGTVWALALPVSASANGLGRHDLSAFLAILAVTGYAMALLPRRAVAAWAGASCASVVAWIELGAADVQGPETYSGSSAVLLLLAGLLMWRQSRQAGSVLVLGPALGMALMPSALFAFVEAADSGAGTLRAVLVILIGAALAVGGAVGRIRAAFLIGLAASLLAGLGQVFALAELVPRWVALGVGGVLLVTTGFAAEAVRSAGSQVRILAGRMR
jgi:hypothetical protein